MFRFTGFPWLTHGGSHQDARRTRRPRPGAARRRAKLSLTQLEGRTLPSSFTALTVSDLINDIDAANKAGGTNTITLAANTTFDLTTVDNTTDGPTGLPVIAGGKKADNLTVTGQGGDIIQRDTASGTPAFRFFDVASGATLTLNNLTLQNGLAFGPASSADGGAVYNQGTLVLSGATVQNNEALGSNGADATMAKKNGANGQDASGGGIYSSGSLTLQNGSLIYGNLARGGTGGAAYTGSFISHGGSGGNALGGGVCIASGTAKLAGITLSGNLAEGGVGGRGWIGVEIGAVNFGTPGNGEGGGLYVAGGTVSLSSATVQNNNAYGGSAGPGVSSGLFGLGFGGGIFVNAGTVTLNSDLVQGNSTERLPFGKGGGLDIASGATVYIDSFTVNNMNNSPDNIDGTYIPQG
jgi:hypothetical protein